MKKFNIITAYYQYNRGIGFNNKLPWGKISKDMMHFKNITTKVSDPNKKNAIIMGRKTYESIGERKLPDRKNIILSRSHISHNGVFPDLNIALKFCNEKSDIENIFIIGGQQVYEEALKHPLCDKIYVTEINNVSADSGTQINCDTFFPILPKNFVKQYESTVSDTDNNGVKFNLNFKEYQNIYDYQSEENQYIDLVRDILENGEKKEGRNGSTYSIFGPQHVFNLQQNGNNIIPLLTTKRMFTRGIIEELLFFLRGQTDSKILEKENINIWKGNTTKEFLESRKLDYEEGDMGPMYGYQWRHFGADYQHCHTDYTGKGFDQLKELLGKLLNVPNDRRLLLSTYNPADISKSVLAPCHGLSTQFYVRQGKFLDCKMYQRSVDVGLGYPFNIASYAILVHIICKVTNYLPGKLIMTLGDTHIYDIHREAISAHLKRTPYKFPTFNLNKEFYSFNNNEELVNDCIAYIESLSIDDFKLENYHCHPRVTMDMVA